MPSTLVVEDEVSLRNDLVVFLDAKGYAATGVGTLSEAMRAVETKRFDLVVLDIGLPDGNGLDLLAQIRSRYGLECGVVVLSSRQDVEDRILALETGSDVYLIKHSSLREIDSTLRSVLKRLPKTTSPPQTAWFLDPLTRLLISPSGDNVPLTPKEITLLSLLAASGSEFCGHAKLGKALGNGADLSVSNINTIVCRLRNKVEDVIGSAPPIHVAYGKGYTFAAPIIVRDGSGETDRLSRLARHHVSGSFHC